MNLFGFALLADENIHPLVVSGLRARGCDITTAADLGLAGASDQAIISRATAERRVVLTHDPDFGRLAVLGNAISFGVVFVRPGHISPDVVLAALAAADDAVELIVPFVATIEHKVARVRIRIRQLQVG